ncbi:hypothetical protein D1B31_18560 [Neobacillus notoginsengisoli]|uniref:Uncharacterized protein n=1 Tax=Neobacillus notoginsengisoli TaxID=1578198 RepID=A0A417YQR0_9BACI|nr:hypothetical protein [Neobacillus notoginsengisoli]RHW36081.1 hypothetical protein D1B31_18560 [Neobacillus notoginsengisoli]
MELLELIKLEEYRGQKFLVEFVEPIPSGSWFKIHTSHGLVLNITIEGVDTIERARNEVIQAYKKQLDGREFD